MTDTQRQAEEERVLPETEWEQCPNCPNVGYYAAGDPQNPEQIQCEWCETNWKSPFYQTRNLPRILESLAVREREERKADIERLSQTMIACELATGHGEDIDSLCLELRTEWEELISKYIFERQKNKAMEERWNMLKQLESSPHPSKKEER